MSLFSQEELVNDVENTAVELTADDNSIIDSISDLVAIKSIDESEVIDNVGRRKEKSGEDVRYEIIDDGFEIVFIFKNIGTYRYQIKMISNNELVLEGIGVGSEGHSCYMERK